ncbi:hypothetical protein DENSPDRAFT_455079 [Dentipellis sp. KUC8613]|nr:hypothetical protein DENSPDRAFT_455079 [Dentipellis sp. KUC8613]
MGTQASTLMIFVVALEDHRHVRPSPSDRTNECRGDLLPAAHRIPFVIRSNLLFLDLNPVYAHTAAV